MRCSGVEWPALMQAFVDINWLYFSFLLFVFTCVADLRGQQVHAEGAGRAAGRASPTAR